MKPILIFKDTNLEHLDYKMNEAAANGYEFVQLVAGDRYTTVVMRLSTTVDPRIKTLEAFVDYLKTEDLVICEWDHDNGYEQYHENIITEFIDAE